MPDEAAHDGWRAAMERRVAEIEARLLAVEQALGDSNLQVIADILSRLGEQSKAHGEKLDMILATVQALIIDPAKIAEAVKNLQEHTAKAQAALDSAPK